MKYWCSFVIFACFVVAFVKCQSSLCTTPNGEKTLCVPLTSCPTLLAAADSKDASVLKFINESSCGEGFLVCCGKSANYTAANETQYESHRDLVIKTILPSRRVCGYQHTDDYFYNLTTTSVDEFPWMVYIPFYADFKTESLSRKPFGCLGVIISHKYVLTDDICRKAAQKRFRFVVVAGTHHIYQDITCINTTVGEQDCTFDATEITVSETMQKGNIVLLRLEQGFKYTDYIRPICLPLNETDVPKAGEILLSSGWGDQQLIDGTEIKLKKRIKHILWAREECEKGNPLPNAICAATQESNYGSICEGDNGGPLMYYKPKKYWIAQGIITATTACRKHQPVVGERLTPETVEWIIENMNK